MSVIDCRGLACPQPVFSTKQALEQFDGGELIVIVDNATSCNNVERFVHSQGCSLEIKEQGQDFYIHIQKPSRENNEKAIGTGQKEKKVVVYINSQLLGGGDEALGSFLMNSFFKNPPGFRTKTQSFSLGRNSGVHLAAEDSKVLETI